MDGERVRRAWRWARLGVPVLLGACGAAPQGEPDPVCRVVQRTLALPDGLGEASGAAWSRAHAGAFWSHNDSGGDPELYLVAVDGSSADLPVRGAAMRDWEDLALAPCEQGRCLLVGDIGNNGPDHPLTLYVVPEPPPGARWATVSTSHTAVFADGRQRDAEALFALPDGSVFLITKGNREPVELYRWPTPLSPRDTARLERVRELAPEPEQPGDRVTGASASPDGRFVAVRTYSTLALYRTADLLGSGDPFARVDLLPLGEGQGEGVALGDDGGVVLVSESGAGRLPGTGALLSCRLPEPAQR